MIYPDFTNEREYLTFLETRAALPPGFSVSTDRIQFTASERPSLEPYRMDLSLIRSNKPTDRFAAVFTKNAFPGAPVIIGRKRLSEQTLSAILVNNKISNVRAATGVEDALALSDSVASQLSVPSESVWSVSTGIIGWRLPVEEMSAVIPNLCTRLTGGSILPVAQSIMTTDSFPKIRRVDLEGGSIVGIAKGAGMVEPDMATMLVFILTDLDVSRQTLRAALPIAVGPTFNSISVDSDMSTSDMVLVASSGTGPSVDEARFTRALTEVCGRLAGDVVRNGEGTGHVMEITVAGAADHDLARGVGKAIANSALVKTAVYGNDPNVGRLVSAIGDYMGSNDRDVDPGAVTIQIGDEQVYSGGAFTISRDTEVRLSDYLKSTALNPRLTGYPQHQRVVRIAVDLHQGDQTATVWGSDLSDQYVHENADYRT